MNSLRRKILVIFLLVIFSYVVSYVIFRAQHIEIWPRNNEAYVIFPKQFSAIYYLYRPLTYVDGIVTGMKFHLGSHQS